MPRLFPHERVEKEKSAEDEPLPEEQDKRDTESKNPVESIFAIIDQYYEGLNREKEGMGVD